MKETRLKILQYITGVGLFVVAGWHIWFSHLTGEEITEWQSVSERAASSGWLAFYILLLVFGLYHGLHGLRTVILEFSVPARAAKVLDWALVLVGVAILGYAAYIPISAY
jgi:succinate dehydrogenase / fumarate reductase membrane anchor subunit